MKASADFQQRTNTPVNFRNAAGRSRDTRQDLEQSALPCSVETDDSDNVAAFNLEGNVFQRPNMSVPLRRALEASKRRTSRAGDNIPQRLITLEGSYPILFAEIFTSEGEISHRFTGINRKEILCSSFLLVILLTVITLVVIVIVRLNVHVVEDHAEDLCADVAQQLFRTSNNVPRASAAMHNQQHAVDHRRNQHTICEGADRGRVDDDVGVISLQSRYKPAHLFRPKKLGGVRRNWSRS